MMLNVKHFQYTNIRSPEFYDLCSPVFRKNISTIQAVLFGPKFRVIGPIRIASSTTRGRVLHVFLFRNDFPTAHFFCLDLVSFKVGPEPIVINGVKQQTPIKSGLLNW